MLELKNVLRNDTFEFVFDVSKEGAKRKSYKKILIVFKNCKFEKVIYNINKNLSREHWRLLGNIDKKIGDLEKKFEKEMKKENLKYRKMNE